MCKNRIFSAVDRRGNLFAAAVLLHVRIFAEYVPPLCRNIVPCDLHSYHYALMDFALRELRAGRLPARDPSVYWRISLLGDI